MDGHFFLGSFDGWWGQTSVRLSPAVELEQGEGVELNGIIGLEGTGVHIAVHSPSSGMAVTGWLEAIRGGGKLGLLDVN